MSRFALISLISLILLLAVGTGLAAADDDAYLAARALFRAGDHAGTVAAVDRLLADHPATPWIRKARFLKAKALLELRRFAEAEAIYEAEAARLLGTERKEEFAREILSIADALAKRPSSDDPGGKAPDYARAANLYTLVLDLEIGRDLRDEVMFKLAVTRMEGKDHSGAARDFLAWLAEFDPDWTGPVGSAERLEGRKRENPPPRGSRILEARYLLAVTEIALGHSEAARIDLSDLLGMLPPDRAALAADVRWQIFASSATASEARLAAARDFLARHPGDPRVVLVAAAIPSTLQGMERHDEAVAAYQDFIDGKGYSLPEGEAARTKHEDLGGSPADLLDLYRMRALFAIGLIRLKQKEYGGAVEAFRSYVTRHPNGPDWAAAQRLIVNAEFQMGIDAVAEGKLDLARERFREFLTRYPLDGRARQILFTLGQMHYAEGERLEEEGKPAEDAWRAAVSEWEKLVAKYPGTEESSLALYNIGVIREEKLGELAAALEAYRKLDWGSHSGKAAARIAVMTKKHLALSTERKFRTDEPARVRIAVRNIEKLTVKLYPLDLEAYFRKTHGVTGVDDLDIALIQPDSTFEVVIAGYEKYLPIEQEVVIPFPEGAAGVCLVQVGEEDLEATTLVVRSDLDLIVKSSRREVLVFAENTRTGTPAAGVTLLVSDGKEVFATGKTGADGVFRGRFDRLRGSESVRVMGMSDGSVASDQLDLAGLSMSTGLAPRGYVYADRPAYRPGQTVNIRGILRDVADGSYRVPGKDGWVLTITDPAGRIVWEEEKALSEFGTLSTTFPLPAQAALGDYLIRARKAGSPVLAFAGQFKVLEFQLRKMRLELKTARRVYFRGEVVELDILAEYYWGAPVAGCLVKYELPDGRRYIEPTDENGRLTVRFDTTGAVPPRPLTFSASIEGEDVESSLSVVLPKLGFVAAVEPARDLVLAGEPVDIKITTRLPYGDPVARSMTLFVLRKKPARVGRVLPGVPWIAAPGQAAAEVTVEEHDVTTDETTGEATVRLTLEEGGTYRLRVGGKDRFGQAVSAESSVTVSDDEDETRLRIFSETDTLKVGEGAVVRIHSRLPAGLALLTIDAETILSHEVRMLEPGMNELTLSVDHEHYPNFGVSVAALDGRKLRSAEKPFTVERRLIVKVGPKENAYRPGAPGEILITATDQLGRPVRAEFSLALVDEALFARFEDEVPGIQDFFQRGARRFTEFRLVATNGFEYRGKTRPVVTAVREEEGRQQRAAEEIAQLERLRAQLEMERQSGRMYRGGGAEQPIEQEERVVRDAQEDVIDELSDALTNKRRGGKRAAAHFFGEMEPPAPLVRRDLPSAGYWNPSVVTGEDGTATVRLVLPESTSNWRITVRGATVETLVGEATGSVVTRQDFFVEMKAPGWLMEGDKTRVLARVHNLTDYAGPVEVTLTMIGGEDFAASLIQRTVAGTIAGKGTTEILLPEVVAPGGAAVRLRVSAAAGGLVDAVEREVPVFPWGLEVSDTGGGTAKSDAAVGLELPPGSRYGSRRLTVTVGPNLERALIETALEGNAPNRLGAPTEAGGHLGSDLLAVALTLKHARAAGAPQPDLERLDRRVRSLVSAAVAGEKDGRWAWTGGTFEGQWPVSARTFWALIEARDLGFPVDAGTIDRARAWLADLLTKLEVKDTTAKAAVLHALSKIGAADFAHLNRLHRERGELTTTALALTAMAFANLGRFEFAGELVDQLATKVRRTRFRDRDLAFWPGDEERWTWYDEYYKNEIERTALSLMALLRVRPGSPLAAPAVAFLQMRGGAFGCRPAAARGTATAALAKWFSKGRYSDTDSRITVLVNGEAVRTVTTEEGRALVTFFVLKERIKEGKNLVEFRAAGRGEYTFGATLSGFSTDMTDSVGRDRPYVHSRYYYHAPLTYRGRSIGVDSTSPVGRIEVGQRVEVHVNLYGTASHGYLVIEEPIPAGAVYVEGSLVGIRGESRVRDGKLLIFIPPGQSTSSFRYQLAGFATGEYRVLPTIIRDAMQPDRIRLGKAVTLTVLAPGERSDDPYDMNLRERYELGRLHFEDGLFGEALTHLADLFAKKRDFEEREVARMLLWIYTTKGFYDARRIVDAFEVLRERYPDLRIPFDKILVVGRAYRDIGEHERAGLVYKATIDASFVNDSNVSAVLEDEGQFLGSIDYQEDLWREYPDTAEVTAAYFALSQALYRKAPDAHLIDEHDARKLTKVGMLTEATRLLDQFLTLYPDDPLADDAAFSMANAYLDLKQYDEVIRRCVEFEGRFKGSKFESGFKYMAALGHFLKRDYDDALAAAKVVGEGKSDDRDFARYIVGQIYHAKGSPAEAIEWYGKVREKYPDAGQAIDYFERKSIDLEEVTVVRPGSPVELGIDYRNIREAVLQVYRVDLMKLYLSEKNLSRIARVRLAGIRPEIEKTIPLGDGKDYVDKKIATTLDLTEEAAYLVICRGDDLFASGLVLITPLEIEVQEDVGAGMLRVNVLDLATGAYASEVHVKAIGSEDSEFKSGETDLRGVFVAGDLRGKPTVIARAGESRYAFYRGETWLGAPASARPQQGQAGQQRQQDLDYQQNLRELNRAMQGGNIDSYDQMRRSKSKGVEVQQAR